MRRALVLFTALAAAIASAAPRPGVEQRVPGRVIVKWKAGSGLAGRVRSLRGARFERLVGDEGDAVHLLHADDASPEGTERLLAELAADPDVEYAEPDRVRTRFSIDPNDPLFSSQWSLRISRIPDAWARTRGDERVTVAILDTGVLEHPDLRDRLLPGYDFISESESAGDGNGRDPDPTDMGTADPTSSGLHGMHVAGIVAAHSDNHLGITGIDWNCGLLPVRVLGLDGGRGTDSDIADAIRWASGLHVAGVPDNPHPAAVINLSFGGPGGSRTLQAAVDAAVGRGTIIVAAAGNDAADTGDYAPAGLLHVIAVGAVLATKEPAPYSNHGARVDVMAPGGDLGAGEGGGVLSTIRLPHDGFTYGYLAGTSQAAPHVAGVAALMRALDPSLDSDRARAILRASADPTGRCDEGCGGGLLDASAALAAVAASCTDGHCDNAASIPIVVTGGCALSGRAPSSPFALLALLVFGLLVCRRSLPSFCCPPPALRRRRGG